MWPAIAAIAAPFVGSALAGRSAERAARTSANAQLEAAQLAAEEQRFRPVGISTRFGTSRFEFGPEGRLTGAGYTTSPEIQALQDRLSALYGTSLGQAERAPGFVSQLGTGAEGLFGLARQAIPTSLAAEVSPEAAAYAQQLRGVSGQLMPTTFAPQVGPEAQAYINRLNQLSGQITPTSYDPTAAARGFFEQQQAILEPSRRAEEQRLAASAFGRGRTGLNIGMMGQPELTSLAEARRRQDLQLGLEAQQRARQQLQQDIGLGLGFQQQALGAGVAEQDRLRAQALQNLQLATGFGGTALDVQQRAEELARQRLRSDIGLGTGLFGSAAQLLGTGYGLQTQALAPFQTQFGISQLLEQAGQQPLDIGAQIGGRSATAGANVGQSLLTGGLGAARTQLQGSLVGPSLTADALSRINYNQLFGQLTRPNIAPGVNVFGAGFSGPQLTAEEAATYFGG